MNKKLVTLACCLLLSISSTWAQSDRDAAKDFGLTIIQSFFDQNCDFMFDHLSTTITSFESGQQISITPETRRLFCADNPLRPDIPVTYQMYQENYAPTVYDKNELSQKFPEWASHLNLQAGDYFFDGAHPIAAGNTRVFRAGDMARFVVRKVNNDWVIIAI